MYHHITKNTSTRAFSLVELMVALTIFSVVITMAMGTLLTLMHANTKAQAISTAMTNISFALDNITRTLRVGYNFYCADAGTDITGSGADLLHTSPYNGVRSCSSGGGAIVFTHGLDNTKRIGYRLNNNQIEQRIDKVGVSDSWVPITSNTAPSAVVLRNMRFTLVGASGVGAGDIEQPRVSLYIDGYVDGGARGQTDFRVQSNVTQRILNF